MFDAKLLEELADAAREAGEAILAIVRRGFEIESKHDSSPVTEADRAAELIILGLWHTQHPEFRRQDSSAQPHLLPRRSVGRHEGICPRRRRLYREIGLVEGGTPRLGLVHAPATGRLHGGIVGSNAWVEERGHRRAIRTRERGSKITAVASKWHLNQATSDYLKTVVGSCDYISVGSSLKFCLVAEGRADIYPRAAQRMGHRRGSRDASGGRRHCRWS